MKVNVTAIQDNTVHGTIGEKEFSATPFQWGSKMLMKVVGDNTFTQGEKIAIGHAAKKALRTAQVELPTPVLKRPRKEKAEPVQEAPPKEDFTGKTVKELRNLCKERGIKGHSRDGVTRTDLITLLGG
jgi:hypothetical protein